MDYEAFNTAFDTAFDKYATKACNAAPLMPTCKPLKGEPSMINKETIEVYLEGFEHIAHADNTYATNKAILELVKAATFLLAENRANIKYIERLETMNDKLLGRFDAEL